MKAELSKKYINQWVALSPDKKRVLASAKTFLDLDHIITSKNLSDAVMFFVQPVPFYGTHTQ